MVVIDCSFVIVFGVQHYIFVGKDKNKKRKFQIIRRIINIRTQRIGRAAPSACHFIWSYLVVTKNDFSFCTTVITTGIKAVNNDLQDDDAIYDPIGYRMNADQLKPGIYIKGGKKILVK